MDTIIIQKTWLDHNSRYTNSHLVKHHTENNHHCLQIHEFEVIDGEFGLRGLENSHLREKCLKLCLIKARKVDGFQTIYSNNTCAKSTKKTLRQHFCTDIMLLLCLFMSYLRILAVFNINILSTV